MTVQELIRQLQTVVDKDIEVRMPCNGLLVPLGSAKLGYMIQGKTDEDYPNQGWVHANPEKLPEGVAVILEPGDED